MIDQEMMVYLNNLIDGEDEVKILHLLSGIDNTEYSPSEGFEKVLGQYLDYLREKEAIR